jgi:nucleoside-triphosphatase
LHSFQDSTLGRVRLRPKVAYHKLTFQVDGDGMMEVQPAEIRGVLQDAASDRSSVPRRYILTGDSGAGKTRWCAALVEAAQQRGLTVGGVISPGVYVDGRRVGIDLQLVETGERRRLAVRRPKVELTKPTKKWEMDTETLRWGNQALRRLGEIDLLIVDELGPLEFVHDDGLVEAFRVVDQGNYRVAVLVVRPSLLELALQRWRESQVIQVP